MEQRQNKVLTIQDLSSLSKKHKKTIQKPFNYDLSNEEEYCKHSKLIYQIGQNYSDIEFRKFEIDEHNQDILRFLLYYFNNCKLACDIFPERSYKLHKNLLLVGEPGTGKTMIMQIFSDYLRETKNPNFFHNLSLTQMVNYYKINGHIDRYTFNEQRNDSFDGVPFNICLNDIGLRADKQKHFGTDIELIIEDFLFARYEIFQNYRMNYHLTSNLSAADFKKRYEERIVDRFKSFNVIPLLGKSRRK